MYTRATTKVAQCVMYPEIITKWRGSYQSYQAEWVVGWQVVCLQGLEAPFKRWPEAKIDLDFNIMTV